MYHTAGWHVELRYITMNIIDFMTTYLTYHYLILHALKTSINYNKYTYIKCVMLHYKFYFGIMKVSSARF